MGRLIDDLMARTHELLQPNPGDLQVNLVNVIKSLYIKSKNQTYVEVQLRAIRCKNSPVGVALCT
jgi:hypothetical protein